MLLHGKLKPINLYKLLTWKHQFTLLLLSFQFQHSSISDLENLGESIKLNKISNYNTSYAQPLASN